MSESVVRVIEDARSTVKWFDARKGYGFIVGPQEQDVFVHFSVIEAGGFRALRDGAQVVYDAELTDRGWRATRVVPSPEVHVELRRGHTRTPRR
jgi:CspA family cold shock protein